MSDATHMWIRESGSGGSSSSSSVHMQHGKHGSMCGGERERERERERGVHARCPRTHAMENMERESYRRPRRSGRCLVSLWVSVWSREVQHTFVSHLRCVGGGLRRRFDFVVVECERTVGLSLMKS